MRVLTCILVINISTAVISLIKGAPASMAKIFPIICKIVISVGLSGHFTSNDCVMQVEISRRTNKHLLLS